MLRFALLAAVAFAAPRAAAEPACGCVTPSFDDELVRWRTSDLRDCGTVTTSDPDGVAALAVSLACVADARAHSQPFVMVARAPDDAISYNLAIIGRFDAGHYQTHQLDGISTANPRPTRVATCETLITRPVRGTRRLAWETIRDHVRCTDGRPALSPSFSDALAALRPPAARDCGTLAWLDGSGTAKLARAVTCVTDAPAHHTPFVVTLTIESWSGGYDLVAIGRVDRTYVIERERSTASDAFAEPTRAYRCQRALAPLAAPPDLPSDRWRAWFALRAALHCDTTIPISPR